MYRRRRLAGALLVVMLVAGVVAQARAQAGPPISPRFLLEAVRVEPPGGDAEPVARPSGVGLHKPA